MCPSTEQNKGPRGTVPGAQSAWSVNKKTRAEQKPRPGEPSGASDAAREAAARVGALFGKL